MAPLGRDKLVPHFRPPCHKLQAPEGLPAPRIGPEAAKLGADLTCPIVANWAGQIGTMPNGGSLWLVSVCVLPVLCFSVVPLVAAWPECSVVPILLLRSLSTCFVLHGLGRSAGAPSLRPGGPPWIETLTCLIGTKWAGQTGPRQDRGGLRLRWWVCLMRVSCVSLLRVPVGLLPCYVGSFLFAVFGMLVVVSMSEAPALATFHD